MNAENSPEGTTLIWVSPNRFAYILAGIALALALASTISKLLARLFPSDATQNAVIFLDLNKERNLPTYFAVVILIIAAGLLLLIAVLQKKARRGGFGFWLALSVCFLIMAFDEAYYFHELLSTPIKKLLSWQDYGLFYYAWVLAGFLIVAVFTIVFLRFWWNLPRRTRGIFLVAAICYILGSVGFEMLGGLYAEHRSTLNLTYLLVSLVEESLEMAGVIIFIWGLLLYLGEQFAPVRFQFSASAAGSGEPAKEITSTRS